MEICFCIHSFQIGGCERQLLSICSHLSKRGHRILLLYSTVRGSFHPPPIEGVTFHHIPAILYKLRLIPLYLAWLFRKKPPLFFHCHSVCSFTEQILWYAQRRNIPTILKIVLEEQFAQLQRERGEEESGWLRHLENRLLARLRKKLYHRVTTYTCISRAIEKELLTHQIGEEHATFLPNGVDLNHFYPLPFEEKKRLKERFGLSSSESFITMVGRFVKRKRQRDLLLAWSRIACRYPSHQLLFVGEGPEKNSCERLAKELQIEERVLFVGEIEEIAPWFQISSFFVFTSEKEGLPNAILEAMASQLPILATKIGGIEDLLEHNETALLFSPGNIEELEEGLIALLDNQGKSDQMAEKAREKIMQDYSFETLLPRFEKLYAKILDKK